jgi:hypothetical protein
MGSVSKEGIGDGLSYGRSYKLVFTPKDQSEAAFAFVQGIPSEYPDHETGLAIEFTVEKSEPPFGVVGTSYATIRIYNMSPDTSRSILQAGLFSLSVGYGNYVSEIYSGSIASVENGREGKDRYTELSLTSGVYHYKTRYFSRTYDKGTLKSTIVTDLVSHLRNGYFAGIKNKVSLESNRGINDLAHLKDHVYGSSKTMKGDAQVLLAQLLPNFSIFITDNMTVNIKFKKKDKLTKATTTEKSYAAFGIDYGQIDSIQYTSKPVDEAKKGLEGNITGIQATGVMIPELNVGTVVQIMATRRTDIHNSTFSGDPDLFFDPQQSDLNVRALYEVKSLVHSGNTFNGDFTTSFSADITDYKAEGII